MDKPSVSQRPQRRTHIEIGEVCALLRRLEVAHKAIQSARDDIAAQTNTLHDWLASSDDFADAWQKFSAAGGTTAKDFIRSLDGRLQPRPVEQRQHLRIIADNTVKQRRIGSGKTPPPNAA
jgi:hypothetical protein